MPQLVHFDPFNPVLLNSPALTITPEQDLYIKEILDLACSDSNFAKKAYDSIYKVLTGTEFVPPTVSSVTPSTALVGSPVPVSVVGTGFNNSSVIVFGGASQTTTYVSETELSATVTTPAAASTVPVHVETEGVASDPVDFVVTDVFALSAPSAKKDFTPPLSKKEEKK